MYAWDGSGLPAEAGASYVRLFDFNAPAGRPYLADLTRITAPALIAVTLVERVKSPVAFRGDPVERVRFRLQWIGSSGAELSEVTFVSNEGPASWWVSSYRWLRGRTQMASGLVRQRLVRAEPPGIPVENPKGFLGRLKRALGSGRGDDDSAHNHQAQPDQKATLAQKIAKRGVVEGKGAAFILPALFGSEGIQSLRQGDPTAVKELAESLATPEFWAGYGAYTGIAHGAGWAIEKQKVSSALQRARVPKRVQTGMRDYGPSAVAMLAVQVGAGVDPTSATRTTAAYLGVAAVADPALKVILRVTKIGRVLEPLKFMQVPKMASGMAKGVAILFFGAEVDRMAEEAMEGDPARQFLERWEALLRN